MEYTVKSGNPEKQRTSCVVVGIFDSRKLSVSAKRIDKSSDGLLSRLVRRGEIEGRLGQTLLLHTVDNVLCERVLLLGCGKEKELDTRAFRKINAVMARTLEDGGTTEVFSCLSELSVKGRGFTWKIRQSIGAIEDALYTFSQLKSKKKTTRKPLRKISFSAPTRSQLHEGETAIRDAMAINVGISMARDLGNLPGNICTPTYLAKRAKIMARDYNQITCKVLEESEMEKLGMGSLLSVSHGSREAAKMIILNYRGGKKDQKPVVLVGKGVTFDSGGISLKPGAAMDEMKFDMCGAASVFGSLAACAEMQIPLNVVGVVPSVENMPDGLATKPGDVVTSMSGITIEVLNTDAEGRLILCDALTYVDKFHPDVVIDIATLTGACVVALGAHTAGLMGNNAALNRDLLKAGKECGDRCWELPLWDEYQEQIETNFADIANLGGKGAGTITAACFLSRFTDKYHWAHLDIAGVAWKSGKEKGATGRPVGLLTQYLLDRADR